MTYRVILANLKARTAVHIGSGEDSELTDALLRRDAQGRPFIPGTAIAGALRALLTRLAPRLNARPCVALTAQRKSCDCAVCRLFGDLYPSDEGTSSSAASRVLVFNAPLKGSGPLPLIRDGVGIDRTTGTAARAGALKFDLEVLPAGAEFELRIELRDPTEEDERLLAVGLAEWQEGRMWLGGNVARGLGAFDLTDLEYRTFPMEQPESLLEFLRADQPWQQATPHPDWLRQWLNQITLVPAPAQPDNVSRCWVQLDGVLQAEGPLLTSDTLVAGATGFDRAPVLSRWGDWTNPVLPGASLRGVLRAHAERIARTLATGVARDEAEFLQKCPACSPVESRPEAPLASCDALLRGKVRPDQEVDEGHLCLACRLFGSTRRGSRLRVEDAPYHPTEQQPKPVLKMLDFLAIDRFTGGGAEGLKFDALALWKPAFRMRLSLENPRPWELGWLALVLRDLAEGWLRIGYGAARGFGQVRLLGWKFTLGFLTPDDVSELLIHAHLPQGKSGIYSTVEILGGSDLWRELASRWVEAFTQEVRAFVRPQELVLTRDSYFGQVDTLYVWEGGVR